jgi:hypothetical protein
LFAIYELEESFLKYVHNPPDVEVLFEPCNIPNGFYVIPYEQIDGQGY